MVLKPFNGRNLLINIDYAKPFLHAFTSPKAANRAPNIIPSSSFTFGLVYVDRIPFKQVKPTRVFWI